MSIEKMAAPAPALALPHDITHHDVALDSKPGASIHYTFAQSREPNHSLLIVFLNGLMTDKSSWLPTMAGIIRKDPTFPPMLAYDRYGQGMTEDRDPQDQGREKGYGHDAMDCARDLEQLVTQVFKRHYIPEASMPNLILVANSIGCAIARLFMQEYPERVEGAIFLDSIMANSNFDFWPDPDAADFDADELPEDVSVETLREQRARFTTVFSPNAINKEGLDRRNLAELLPYSNRPTLQGAGVRGPWLTIVGHDFETFAAESLKACYQNPPSSCSQTDMGVQTMGTPISLSMQYSNPLWHEYNVGLSQLTEQERSRGPIIAPGCGHFIQRDNAQFVVKEVLELLDRIRMSQSSHHSADLMIDDVRQRTEAEDMRSIVRMI